MTGSLSASENYFGVPDRDLIYFVESGKWTEKSEEALCLKLRNSFVRTMILKNAFYSTAQNLGMKADHVDGWNYKVTSDGRKVLVGLQQSGNSSYLRFPLNSDKDKQKEFLLDFVKNLEEILKK